MKISYELKTGEVINKEVEVKEERLNEIMGSPEELKSFKDEMKEIVDENIKSIKLGKIVLFEIAD